LRQSSEATQLVRRRLRRRPSRTKKIFRPSRWNSPSISDLDDAVASFQHRLHSGILGWQIELVFKRMKSILGRGHFTKKDPLSAEAWLEGKLFLLIERMLRTAGSLSPWGYPLAAASQSVA
jgi:hypothetical protein